jgi:hypothetical protein
MASRRPISFNPSPYLLASPPPPDAVRRWVTEMRAAIDDADSITRDMTLPRRRRYLGPAKHEELYDAAHRAQVELIDRATSPEGAPPVHGERIPP